MPDSNDSLSTLGPYVMLEKLGSGSFATVYRCEHTGTHIRYAGKLYDIDFAISEGGFRMVKREISILKLLRSTRVIRFQDVVYTTHGILVVMELVEGRTLLSLIPPAGGLPESFARQVFIQILEALSFLHCNGIVHRDLKLENIMIRKDGNIKVIDFGLSDYVRESARGAGLLVKNRCGSPHYYAPEVILAANREKFQGDKVDIWAVGVILYSMVTGFHPFFADDDKDETLYQQIVDVEITYDSGFSRELDHLLRRIFVKDPEERASLRELQSHPWTNNTALAGMMDGWFQRDDITGSSSDSKLIEFWSHEYQLLRRTRSSDSDSFPQGPGARSSDTVSSRAVSEGNDVPHTNRSFRICAVDRAKEPRLITRGSHARPKPLNFKKTGASKTHRAVARNSLSESRKVSYKSCWKFLKGCFKVIFGRTEMSELSTLPDSSDETKTADSHSRTQSSGANENGTPLVAGNTRAHGHSMSGFEFEGRTEYTESGTALAGPYCKISFRCWGSL